MTYEPWMGQCAGLAIGVFLIWLAAKLDERGIVKFDRFLLAVLAVCVVAIAACCLQVKP